MIYYGCPKCQSAMASPESQAGQTETCPECGNVTIVPQPNHPNGSNYAPVHSGKVTTTERTSKRLKLHIMIAWLLLIVGVILFCVGLSNYEPDTNDTWFVVFGLLLGVVGIIWGIATRIDIWWRHG